MPNLQSCKRALSRHVFRAGEPYWGFWQPQSHNSKKMDVMLAYGPAAAKLQALEPERCKSESSAVKAHFI